MIEVYEFEDKDSLICKIEVNEHCVTLFGRVADDHKRWNGPMQELIRAVKPDVNCHPTDEERAKFHPNGSPKKVGYKYFHHVHSKYNLSETLERVKDWLPKEI